MKAKKLLQFVMLFLAAGFSSTASPFAPQGEPGECGCRTNQISINTGINHSTGTVLPAGSFDPMWVVTTVPSSSGLSVPAIPYVITPNPVWGSYTPPLQTALNGSAGWLSPFNTATYSINNPYPDNPFTFRLDFCVCTQDQYKISGMMCADDEGQLWLDGTTMICNVPNWHNVINFSTTMPLTAGGHYLELKLRNTGSQVMGIGMSGTIVSASGNSSLMGYDCCNPRGGINGRKWLDRDCDGKFSEGDEVGSGWTFTLNPGGYIATSDVLGYYNFPNIPPGTYTLTELPQAGWTPIAPAGGTTTVTVTAGNVVTVDFLNSNCSVSCDLECYWKVTGNNLINPSINYFGTNNGADVIVKTNSTQRAVIEGGGDGNMGIATPSPTTILHVYSAPPPAGAPSGLRFEKLPTGKGYILVVDDDGYVYRTEKDQASKMSMPVEMLEMQNQMTAMQQEIASLKALLTGSEGSTLTVSPNPTGGQVKASYRIGGSYANAIIKVTDKSGRAVLSNVVSGSEGSVNFTIPGNVVSGDLICTLVVDGKVTATQKLVLSKQ